MDYTVLVVDDEFELRRAMIERVDWAAAGFKVVGEAENGVEALDLIETLEPDLILTDIKMPMISGLELAAKVRELRPATQIVILSGYDSFEYARTAIDYNIISYLLKPISSAEMSQELFEIHRRMDEKIGSMATVQSADANRLLQNAKRDAFLLPLLLGGNETKPDNSRLLQQAQELGLVLKNGEPPRFCVLVLKFKNEQGRACTGPEHIDFIHNVLGQYFSCSTLVVYGRAVTLVAVQRPGELSNLLELPLLELVQTAKRLLQQTCTVGVSRAFTGLADCGNAYFQAVTARRYTRDGAGEVRFINDQEPNAEFAFDRAEKTAMGLEQLLKVGTKEQLNNYVNSLYEQNTPENANLLVMQVLATVYRVVSAVTDKSGMMKLFAENPVFSRFTTNSSQTVLKNEMAEFCSSAKQIIESSQKRESEVLCDRVVEMINERYSDETLSLTGVSNALAVSPNYLSALIKKNKQKNFVTLLTERRMQAARDMILCTEMKMLEIAEKCGYNDQHYFSYCFKKFYGESPNKVRACRRSV